MARSQANGFVDDLPATIAALKRMLTPNTVAVFVSVLFWGRMWDVWGPLIRVPIMVAIKPAADHIDPLQAVGELPGR